MTGKREGDLIINEGLCEGDVLTGNTSMLECDLMPNKTRAYLSAILCQIESLGKYVSTVWIVKQICF